MLPANCDNPWVELNITLSSSSFAATPATRLARSRAMLRSGCVDGPGVNSSGDGGTDGSRCWEGGNIFGFGGGEAIEADGKSVDVEAVALLAEIDSGAGGGTMWRV